MARGNGRMQLFHDDVDYRWFIHLLGDVMESLDVDCWNYCAMPNHYHATLVPTQPNFSEAIQRLNGVFAQWWNRRHARVGHVFQGRFKDQLVQDDLYVRALSRYIALNPVRAKLVSEPEDWPWSSYRATIGLAPTPSFLVIGPTLRLFNGEDELVQRQRFADYIAGPLEPELDDRIRSKERIIGDRAFKLSIASRMALPTAGGVECDRTL
jgi:REP element-mobilizing transposase RayT